MIRTHKLPYSVLKGKPYKHAGDKHNVELIFICPACKKPKLYVNAQKKTFMCFVCSAGGVITGDTKELDYRVRAFGKGVVSLADESKEPFELPPHAPLSKEAHSYLTSRGIQDSSIQDFGIVEGTHGKYDGYHDTWWRRIIFPVFDSYGNPAYCTGRTYRARDKRLKYLCPRQEKKKHVFRTFQGKVERAFLVEGVIDALKIHQQGFQALALLGKTLSPEQKALVLDTIRSRCVIIVDAGAWTQAIKLRDILSPYLVVDSRLLERGDVGDRNDAEINKLTSTS